MEWTFDSNGPLEVDLVVPAGHVAIEGGSGDNVVVALTPLGDSRRAEALISESEVELAGGKLRVHVPHRRARRVELGCKLVVPERTSVSASTGSADLRCSVPLEAFKGITASGDISLVGVASDASVRSASGAFTCAAVDGALHIQGASSDITVEHVGGNVEAVLASGDLTIGDAGASVKANTASGDVRLRRAHAGTVRVNSGSGDITVGVAPGVGARLDIASGSGKTSCTLPVEETSAEAAALEIVCRSGNGDVRIEGAPE